MKEVEKIEEVKEVEKIEENNENIIKKDKISYKEKSVIVRDILTKKEYNFDSYEKAQKFTKITDITKNSIGLNKPILGFHLRHKKEDSYWEPPENFKFDKDTKYSTQSYFIKTTNKKTNEITYYNSITDCALLLGIYDKDIDPAEKKRKDGQIRNAFNGSKDSLDNIILQYKFEALESCGFLVENGIKNNLENKKEVQKRVKKS